MKQPGSAGNIRTGRQDLKDLSSNSSRQSLSASKKKLPIEALRNLGPILESVPMAFDTSVISAPTCSQRAESELIDDTLWAKKALAASLASSALHRFINRIFSLGTHLAYISASVRWEESMFDDSNSPPIKILSGNCRSLMAVPSDRNSGFDRIENSRSALAFVFRILYIEAAVPQGTVDFSTIIFEVVDTFAICRMADSRYLEIS